LLSLQGQVLPVRMASWYVQQPGLNSRLCIANLASALDQQGFGPVKLTLELFNPQGQRQSQQEYTLPCNGTLAVELTPASPHGLVQVSFKAPLVRSLRFYMHWYGADFITSTHEKYSDPLLKPKRPVHYTLHRYTQDSAQHFSLIVTNLGLSDYSSRLGLINDQGEVCFSAPFTLAPRATAWLDPATLFAEASRFLGSAPGSLYLENRIGTPMVYYAVEDRQGRWQIQHL